MESFQKIKNNKMDLVSTNDPLDKNRLLIEDLWESVLREECPDDQAERLIQLKELSYSCLLYTSPSPRDPKTSRMPSSA